MQRVLVPPVRQPEARALAGQVLAALVLAVAAAAAAVVQSVLAAAVAAAAAVVLPVGTLACWSACW